MPRGDHPRVSSQRYTSCARVIEYATWPRSPVPRIWRKPISSFLKFAQEFEKRFIGQGEDGDRAIIGTHAIAWQRLSLLPPEILTRVGEADLAKYRHWEHEMEAA